MAKLQPGAAIELRINADATFTFQITNDGTLENLTSAIVWMNVAGVGCDEATITKSTETPADATKPDAIDGEVQFHFVPVDTYPIVDAVLTEGTYEYDIWFENAAGKTKAAASRGQFQVIAGIQRVP